MRLGPFHPAEAAVEIGAGNDPRYRSRTIKAVQSSEQGQGEDGTVGEATVFFQVRRVAEEEV